ncbi:hypothetical protein ANCCEY_05824 [Ancylostoma ceylanicum]|uniref:Mannose-6-phosphate isomerase n=1 Tax=Ancylostoma ceylanicum TaxID=53326 RepID=A0A0D6LYB4_9BILA|nr:hypothetical protein ANCCEY_05824 [Ancylostoma ceylanicum]
MVRFREMMEKARSHPDLVGEYVDQLMEFLDNGECVECVGCSNNTIRAAMTPKFIDREALCEVLNYRMTSPEYYLVPAIPLADYPGVEEYAPDCKDFQLHRIRVAPSVQNAFLPVLDCTSIMVIVEGSAVLEEVDGPSSSGSKNQSSINLETLDRRTVSRGDIIYIPPGRRLSKGRFDIGQLPYCHRRLRYIRYVSLFRFTKCTSQLEAFRTYSFEIGPDHENRKVIKEIPATISVKKPLFTIDDYVEKAFVVESEMDGFI